MLVVNERFRCGRRRHRRRHFASGLGPLPPGQGADRARQKSRRFSLSGVSLITGSQSFHGRPTAGLSLVGRSRKVSRGGVGFVWTSGFSAIFECTSSFSVSSVFASTTSSGRRTRQPDGVFGPHGSSTHDAISDATSDAAASHFRSPEALLVAVFVVVYIVVIVVVVFVFRRIAPSFVRTTGAFRIIIMATMLVCFVDLFSSSFGFPAVAPA